VAEVAILNEDFQYQTTPFPVWVIPKQHAVSNARVLWLSFPYYRNMNRTVLSLSAAGEQRRSRRSERCPCLLHGLWSSDICNHYLFTDLLPAYSCNANWPFVPTTLFFYSLFSTTSNSIVSLLETQSLHTIRSLPLVERVILASTTEIAPSYSNILAGTSRT
jgi:hypothetical protein